MKEYRSQKTRSTGFRKKIGDIWAALNTPLADPDGEWREDFRRLHEEDMRDVGKAFANSLVPSVPGGIAELVERLEKVTGRVSPKRAQALLARPDVSAGGAAAAKLAEFGITPSHLAHASDAVGMLLERASDAGYFDRRQSLTLSFRQAAAYAVTQPIARPGHEMTRETLTDQIRTATKLDQKTSEVLLDWLANAARYVPGAFPGFHASEFDGDVQLKNLDGNNSELAAAWKAPAINRKF